MKYHSHVFDYPNTKPFDNLETRWPAFVGEFAAPLVTPRPDLTFWFTHYGDHAKFRVYTDAYAAIQADLEPLRDSLGLVDRGVEKDLTLTGDLGHGRFIGPNSNSTPDDRALVILNALCATARLVVDSVFKQPNGYWAFEKNADVNQNPDESHLFSVNHLFHNMCASDAFVHLFNHGGAPQVLSYYYFHNAANQKQINPQGNKGFRVKM